MQLMLRYVKRMMYMEKDTHLYSLFSLAGEAVVLLGAPERMCREKG